MARRNVLPSVWIGFFRGCPDRPALRPAARRAEGPPDRDWSATAAATLAAAAALVAAAAASSPGEPGGLRLCGCAGAGREQTLSHGLRTERTRVELKRRLIKNLDFIYTCVCDGQKLEDVYCLEEELGKGAFGTVYLARHKTLGHMRAVKRVSKAPPGQENRAPALMREIHALMDLDHPNIVKLVKYFDEGPDIYLVFELCEGPDLFDRIRASLRAKRRTDEAEAASVLRQMLQALKCCHYHYMGHFDVKPENFMYQTKGAPGSSSGNLKMIDLGLSSAFKKDRKEIRGTAEYMAPEVWQGLYGPEADIWSCGVVLFTMLTGSAFVPPLAVEDEIQSWVHDRSWIRQRLRWAKAQGISQDAFDLLSAMLRHSRHQRPTAREALWHPFLKEGNGNPGCFEPEPLRKAADEVIAGLLHSFQSFAAEPVFKRAALLVMAHIAAYTFQESQPQRLAFSVLDRNYDGELSIEALEKHYTRTAGVVPEELEAAFQGVDVDDDGYITYLEFLSATLPETIRFDEPLLRTVFGHLDRNQDGAVDAEDLAAAFRHGRDPDHVCREALREVCPGDARLSWPDFLRLMCPNGPAPPRPGRASPLPPAPSQPSARRTGVLF